MAELLNIVDTIQNTSNNQSITEYTRLIDWLVFYTVSIVVYTNGDWIGNNLTTAYDSPLYHSQLLATFWQLSVLTLGIKFVLKLKTIHKCFLHL